MFIEPSEFDFVPHLEANWQTIRDELMALPDDTFDPWVQRQMHGEGWSVFGLFAQGQPIDGACRQCPRTRELIEAIDEASGGVSLAGFSRLAPQTHIQPHSGWAKSVYRLHLGLIVPNGCRLRVADETRAWEAGKCLIFDDTVEHEAWNDSDETRTTLLLDFLRPGLTDFSQDEVPAEVLRYAKGLVKP